MAYTTDAMISVLQKAYIAVRHKEEVGEITQIAIDNFDETVCFGIAKYMGYITSDYEYRVMSILPEGLVELARLVEYKEDRVREVERHHRERHLSVTHGRSIYLSCASLLVLAITLGVTVWCNMTDTVLRQPIRVEILSTLPTPVDLDTNTNHPKPNAHYPNPCACPKSK